MTKSIDEMSDEEFLEMAPPEIVEDNEQQEPEETEEQITESEESETEEVEGTEEQEVDSEEGTEDSGEEADTETKEPEANKQTQAPGIDYKQFYDSVMSPIKANGKTFQPRTPEEAIRLMQMGANYTQKMQGIAPYRKKIQMLQNAGLLEDEKLNYLIDLSQGNKEAVKKLLKDSKLDPLDLDVNDESAYIPSNHTVSDAEVNVQTVVDDLKSTPQGVETLRLIQGWDQASLKELWETPSMMTTLNEQRQNGVYDLIMNEMEHQRMLGNIPEGTSFLEAYKAVGDYCLRQQAANAYAYLQQQQRNLPQGTLNKPSVNNTQVKSAAPSGRSKKQVQQFVDPFSLSDEEFEKQFGNYA